MTTLLRGKFVGLKTAQPYSDIPVGAARRASQQQQQAQQHLDGSYQNCLTQQKKQQQQQQIQQQQQGQQERPQQGPSPVDPNVMSSPDGGEMLPPLPVPPSVTVNRGQK